MIVLFFTAEMQTQQVGVAEMRRPWINLLGLYSIAV
jgi:hypothetical protein